MILPSRVAVLVIVSGSGEPYRPAARLASRNWRLMSAKS
jgi:hypothetical protein